MATAVVLTHSEDWVKSEYGWPKTQLLTNTTPWVELGLGARLKVIADEWCLLRSNLVCEFLFSEGPSHDTARRTKYGFFMICMTII